MAAQGAYSVSQVNQYIKCMFQEDGFLHSITVAGEVGSCKDHSSGHLYFTLKDGAAAIACVMFAGSRKTGLSFPLTEGQSVEVSGSIEVFERDGRYQLYARRIRMAGVGLLYEEYHRRKREMEARGWFDPARKKPIPAYAQRIGVVTAATGAAIRDIIQVARRRNPYVDIWLSPATVQGEEAPASIAAALYRLYRAAPDVIILGRGGGSLEDLMAFNSMEVGEAIAASPIPLITAIGHETDTTLADFVSDMRAPTPSAAAQLAVFDLALLEEALAALGRSLDKSIERRLLQARNAMQRLSSRWESKSPMARLREKKFQKMLLEERWERAMARRLEAAKNRLGLLAARMEACSPLARLDKGYAYVENVRGRGLKRLEDVALGENIFVHLRDGRICARVEQITPGDLVEGCGDE